MNQRHVGDYGRFCDTTTLQRQYWKTHRKQNLNRDANEDYHKTGVKDQDI